MATIYEIILYVGLIGALVWIVKLGKGKVAGMKTLHVGAVAALLLVVAAFGGALGPVLALFQGQPTPPPAAGGSFQVTDMDFVPGSGVLANEATITETRAASGVQVDLYDTAAGWITSVATNTFAISFDVINLNTGTSTVVFAASYSLLTVGTVEDQTSGNSIPLVLKNANGFWTITYTQGTTVGAVLTQTNDAARETFPLGDSDVNMMTLSEINSGAFNAMVAGQNYAVVYSIAGVSGTLTFHAL